MDDGYKELFKILTEKEDGCKPSILSELLDDIRNEFRKHGWADHILTDNMIVETVKDALGRLDK